MNAFFAQVPHEQEHNPLLNKIRSKSLLPLDGGNLHTAPDWFQNVIILTDNFYVNAVHNIHFYIYLIFFATFWNAMRSSVKYV